MKKLLITGLSLITLLFTIGCTDNQMAKKFGGEFTVDLPKGSKLIEVTWKEDNMWYLTRVRREGETIEEFKFKESSSFGMMEGSVIFKEH